MAAQRRFVDGIQHARRDLRIVLGLFAAGNRQHGTSQRQRAGVRFAVFLDGVAQTDVRTRHAIVGDEQDASRLTGKRLRDRSRKERIRA